jgi:hypothetical protein
VTLRTSTGEQLDAWLKISQSQPNPRIATLGIERDKAAVVAGLTLPQNNGMVEGKVNKLKLIKRMGYGRAGFPLLRKPCSPCLVSIPKGFFYAKYSLPVGTCWNEAVDCLAIPLLFKIIKTCLLCVCFERRTQQL